MIENKLHIIWDLDGTLIDSCHEIKEVLGKSIKEAGFSEKEPVAPFRSGPPLDMILKYMYGDQLSVEDIKQIVSTFRRNYDNCGFNHTLGFEGIEEILANEIFIHHIVTNKPDLATNKIIKKLGWKNYFVSVLTPYSYMKSLEDKRKSKTELFALCMANYPNEKFVGIGDMGIDAEAAFENSILAIGVLWGTGTREELEKCSCDYIIGDVSELCKTLENLQSDMIY